MTPRLARADVVIFGTPRRRSMRPRSVSEPTIQRSAERKPLQRPVGIR